jgi:hypothetical protein
MLQELKQKADGTVDYGRLIHDFDKSDTGTFNAVDDHFPGSDYFSDVVYFTLITYRFVHCGIVADARGLAVCQLFWYIWVTLKWLY